MLTLFCLINNFQANGTARELQKRVDQLERLNIDLKSKLDELNGLYEGKILYLDGRFYIFLPIVIIF